MMPTMVRWSTGSAARYNTKRCPSLWWAWSWPTYRKLWGPATRHSARNKSTALCTGRRSATVSQISTLPTALRLELAGRHAVGLPEIAQRYESTDGTRRYLLRLEDARTVETVLMPEGDRQTICISSQVGCAVDCKFCMTALLGLERNMTAGEIVGRSWWWRATTACWRIGRGSIS